MHWEPVIGLEIHVQLATVAKIFSGAPTAFGAAPNTQACAIDLGLPGVLPVLNAQAVRLAVRLGLAIGAEIAPRSVFARKNYFYPDLPKGYQISQYELPIVRHGQIEIVLDDGRVKTIGITRAHLEEDAGKSLHDDALLGPGVSGIDLNRAGTPLLEIVSAPELHTPAEAVAYARAIHRLVRWLAVSDGNLQEGSLRIDANISLRPQGETRLGTRTEIKNLNSFRFLHKALEFEIARQAEVLDEGGRVRQETRLYDAHRDETRAMRAKEEANDYRYFPDPDLLPLVLTPEFIAEVAAELPELPTALRRRFVAEYGLSDYDADLLTASRATAAYFVTVATGCGDAKLAANWINGALAAALNKAHLDLEASPVSAAALADLLGRIRDGRLSNTLAKQVFEAMWQGEGDAAAVIAARGLTQIGDRDALAALVDEVLAAHPREVADYRAGKEKLFGFLVGQAMKRSKGQAHPQHLNDVLRAKLHQSE